MRGCFSSGSHADSKVQTYPNPPVWQRFRGRFAYTSRLIFSFYSPILMAMRTLPFPKCCVVCCKKCGHDVLAGTDGFPASSVFVVCSLCGEKRRYLPSEVIHGRPHSVVRRKSTRHVPLDTARRGPVAARLSSFRSENMAAGRGR